MKYNISKPKYLKNFKIVFQFFYKYDLEKKSPYYPAGKK